MKKFISTALILVNLVLAGMPNKCCSKGYIGLKLGDSKSDTVMIPKSKAYSFLSIVLIGPCIAYRAAKSIVNGTARLIVGGVNDYNNYNNNDYNFSEAIRRSLQQQYMNSYDVRNRSKDTLTISKRELNGRIYEFLKNWNNVLEAGGTIYLPISQGSASGAGAADADLMWLKDDDVLLYRDGNNKFHSLKIGENGEVKEEKIENPQNYTVGSDEYIIDIQPYCTSTVFLAKFEKNTRSTSSDDTGEYVFKKSEMINLFS